MVFTHSEILMRAAREVHVMEDGVVIESGAFSELKCLNGMNSIKDAKVMV